MDGTHRCRLWDFNAVMIGVVQLVRVPRGERSCVICVTIPRGLRCNWPAVKDSRERSIFVSLHLESFEYQTRTVDKPGVASASVAAAFLFFSEFQRNVTWQHRPSDADCHWLSFYLWSCILAFGAPLLFLRTGQAKTGDREGAGMRLPCVEMALSVCQITGGGRHEITLACLRGRNKTGKL